MAGQFQQQQYLPQQQAYGQAPSGFTLTASGWKTLKPQTGWEKSFGLLLIVLFAMVIVLASFYLSQCTANKDSKCEDVAKCSQSKIIYAWVVGGLAIIAVLGLLLSVITAPKEASIFGGPTGILRVQ